MKNILYTLWILLFLLACSESEQVDYSQLSVDFQKSKIDVGENSGILEIPVVLSGYRTDIPLQVVVQVSAADGEAVAGVDYELIDTKLAFNACGKSFLKIKIIDNKEITKDMKTFTVSMKAENQAVASGIADIKVYIISDDVANLSPYIGNYTLTAQEYGGTEKFTSALGGVEIVQDPDDANKYYLRNMVLVNGDNVLPLTMGVDLYILIDASGKITMPLQQNIGIYDKEFGSGFVIGMTSDGDVSTTPLKIEWKDKSLIFQKGIGLIGVSTEGEEISAIYYALENIVLAKVNK